MRCIVCGAEMKTEAEGVCWRCMREVHTEATAAQERDALANWLHTRVDNMGNTLDSECPKHLKRMLKYARKHGVDWSHSIPGKTYSTQLQEALTARGVQVKSRGRPVKETAQQAS